MTITSATIFNIVAVKGFAKGKKAEEGDIEKTRKEKEIRALPVGLLLR